MILSDKYKITKIITKSTYSTLYEGEHIIKKHKVAIKIETDEIAKRLLEHEINMYLYLKKGGKIKIPEIKYIGTINNYKYIVMELLDKNLKQKCETTIDKTEFISIINQLLYLIATFHNRKLLHRDIKPENFVFDKHGDLCIIDLGLSCFNDNRVMNNFIGNKLYASFNCHLDNYIYTQNDDLISIVYMLLHLYTGILPWVNGYISYKIKKECNLKEYYIANNKYDEIVELILFIYYTIGNKSFYSIISNKLNNYI